MNWKCVCSTENEIGVIKCPNCKRARPEYLKIDINPPERIDTTKESEMLLAVVLGLIDEVEEEFGEFINEKEKGDINEGRADALRTILHDKLKGCGRIISFLRDKFPDFDFSEDDQESNYDTIQSAIELLKGRLIYHAKLYKSAINPLVRSYKLNPNQFALFLLAKCVINLPVDSGASMLKSSKSDVAYQIKHDLESKLLRGVVVMDHISAYGVEAGRLLIDHYSFIIEGE